MRIYRQLLSIEKSSFRAALLKSTCKSFHDRGNMTNTTSSDTNTTNAKDLLPGLPFNLQWLEAVLQARLSTKAKLQAVHGGGLQKGGYVSATTRITFDWDTSSLNSADERLHLPRSAFLKLLPQNDSGSAEKTPESANWDDLIDTKLMHQNELNFYASIRPSYQLLQSFTPKLYYGQNPSADAVGLILIEDLSSCSGMVDLVDGINLEQTLEITKVLGQFQGISLQRDDWRAKFPERVFHKSVIWSWAEILQKQVAPKLWKQFPDLFVVSEADIDRLFPALDAAFAAISEANANHQTVLTHGDLWSNNALFRRKSNGSGQLRNELVAIIDWQATSFGLPTEDVAYLLALSCSPSLRRSNTNGILRTYAEHFELGSRSSAKIDKSIEPIDFNQLCESYKYGFVIGTATLGVLLAMLGDDLEAGKIDPLVERLNAAIEDCILYVI